MFGSNNKEANKPKGNSIIPTGPTHSLNSLVQGTVVEGSVKSESDIRVDGTIRGKLYCEAKVIIGPSGHVNGEIRCKNAVIEGKFEGVLQVQELLNIRESANVSGEVSTNKLLVQAGAVFSVTCSMGAETRKAAMPGVAANGVEPSNEKDKIGKAKPAGV